jgi:nucleoside-diphosphate-sugar epimerase
MRIMVTGHKGYIGTILVRLLVENGHDVVGLDSDLYRRCTFGEGIVEVPEIRKDIRDVEIEELMGFDALLHLAALSNDPLGNIDSKLTYEINYKASVRLAKMARKAGISRFVFSSSCSTYGAAGDELLGEDASFNPITPYGRSKVMVEQEVSRLADVDFSPTFLRNATAYGVSPRLRSDIVLNNLVAWAYTTGLVYLKSDGTPYRPMVHISDIALAFLTVLHAPREKIHNQAFNIGRNSENYRIRDLAENVREVVPNCCIEYAADAGPDKRNYRVDFTKFATTFPGYVPQWDANKGARELYEAYQMYGLKLEDFEGPRYKRLDHIRQLISEGLLDAGLRWCKREEAKQ